jgi:hypothetical protein
MQEGSACPRGLYLTKHNTHNRQPPIPPAGFEPIFPGSELPQTYTLERAAIGIGRSQLNRDNSHETVVSHYESHKILLKDLMDMVQNIYGR